MRISDWSSDVCSSDLDRLADRRIARTMVCVGSGGAIRIVQRVADLAADQAAAQRAGADRHQTAAALADGRNQQAAADRAESRAELGRATGRGRGWNYVEFSVGAGQSKKKKNKE